MRKAGRNGEKESKLLTRGTSKQLEVPRAVAAVTAFGK